MSARWYYSQDGAQYGPVGEKEIVDFIQSGVLPPGTPVCKKDTKDWKPARAHACFQVEIYPRKKRTLIESSGNPDLSIDPDLEASLIQLAENSGKKSTQSSPKGRSTSGSSGGVSIPRVSSPAPSPSISSHSHVSQPSSWNPSASGQSTGSGPYSSGQQQGASHPSTYSVSIYYEEADRRSRHCFLVGLALILGIVFPIINRTFFSGEGYSIAFPLFGGAGVSGTALAVNWAILLVGIGISILSKNQYQGIRGGVMVGLAILNLVLGLVFENPFEGIRGDQETLAALLAVAAFAGWVCLVAGARARHFRPDSGGAHMVGLIGGVVVLAVLVIPILPEDAGYVLVLTPFKVFGPFGEAGPSAVYSGLILMALMAMIICSAILCITNNPTKSFDAVSDSALTAFQLAVLIVPSIFVASIVVLSMQYGEFPALWAIINLSKVCLISAGIIFLLPVGISECILDVKIIQPI